MFKHQIFPLIVLIILVSSCKKESQTLFYLQDNASLGVDFINQLQDKRGTNVFTFRNYYNGGGVGIGDVNNDGLNDVFLTSNQGNNQLLINKGNWKFQNITEKAGVRGSKYWSTGVTMVDINNDGWLDIYVCNSGNANGSETENELFVNQKNGTFKEEAKAYGLADEGLSTHAIFFDYDLDGDLDCYILNNSFRPVDSFDFTQNLRGINNELGGDRLYRNDNGHFVDVTQEALIYSSDIGFGLGVSVCDINQDGYPDIYVSNDFFERDYLYINQKNGTFKEDIQNQMGHLSLASMGSDVGDINNDGQYDIFTTEMLPEDDKRLKTMTSFESYDVNRAKQNDGYYNQYMQNCLQLNNGDNTFSEIAFYAGVAATDWSWGALFMDFDNDGWKDIFVSNGIYKDLTNQDYIDFLSNKDNMEKVAQGKNFDYKDFTDKMTSTPLPNYAFINNRNLTFTNEAQKLGLDKLSYSNGATYGDLDNDGDNDLVVNNVNMPVFFYKNNANELTKNKYLKIHFSGDSLNRFGIGSTIKIFNKNTKAIYYHQPVHGFQSSTCPNVLTIGVGETLSIDSILVIWPNKNYQTLKHVKTDSSYTFDIKNALNTYNFSKKVIKPLFKEDTKFLFKEIPQHQEDNFLDFDNERLMLQMLSRENPYLAKGDVNHDGLEDFYMSSSKGYSAAIYIQQTNGKFLKYIPEDFKKQSYLETAGAVFGDFDNDGDEDLIVCFGGNQEQLGSKVMHPRFYENNGKGQFTWNKSRSINIDVNASIVFSSDIDHDGNLDLFIGGRSVPGDYGSSPDSYVFSNDGKGNFKDISDQVFGKNHKIGMVTAAAWADLDHNGDDDLILAGNWMGIQIFKNHKGLFTADHSLSNYKGWWSSLTVADVDGDGNLDILAGNLGLNTKFQASEKEPMKIYIKDFDNNGTKESITTLYKSNHQSYVFHLKSDLVMQLPILKKRFLRYQDYAGKTSDNVLTDEMVKDAEVHEINTLSSGVFFNKGNGKFDFSPFPYQAQLSCINTILFDHIRGIRSIILAGNSFNFKPEVGRLDANHGQLFSYKNHHFTYITNLASGLNLVGETRSSMILKSKNGTKQYLFGRNNNTVLSYSLDK
ncbi:MAG: VCBS repeat-containing protein [Sphingobacteriales bacterium]|nr:VCBS repeat-containing protein [Sphingobacteriales bacterium]